MDSDSLRYSMDLVAGNGYTLSAEHRAALQTSLVILKKNYTFSRVLFWGKIMGITEDYFIAQGKGDDEINDKKNLYSFNCVDWLILPPVTDQMIEEVSKAAKGRFRGAISYEYEHISKRKRGEREVIIKVNEEKRLSVTIHQIDEDVSVVPRGAFTKNHEGVIGMNRSFGGLTHKEAEQLHNFLHFVEPKNHKRKPVDFLVPLSDDIPTGSWSLQFECCGKVCVIRNLLWLGLTFYHVPMTTQHGYIYIGDGAKNLDLPFML